MLLLVAVVAVGQEKQGSPAPDAPKRTERTPPPGSATKQRTPDPSIRYCGPQTTRLCIHPVY
jgi:hypothetical protein